MKDKLQDVMDKINAGDIILVRGDKFISKSIRFFMERYRKALGLEKMVLYNHAATVVTYKGKKYVAESNGKGVEAATFEEAYGWRLDKIKIISPKKVYSKVEKEKISDIALGDSFQPTRYDFLNFWYQMQMIRRTRKKGQISKPWGGPTGLKAQKRLYCSEAVATWANEIRPNTFKEAWSVNPLDLMINKYYKTIYNGVEKDR